MKIMQIEGNRHRGESVARARVTRARVTHVRVPHVRAGQALMEFAFVAFISVILIGMAFAYGLLLLNANVLQQAADAGAMDLSRLPLPYDVEFPELGQTGYSSTDPEGTTAGGGPNLFSLPDFRNQIFDERLLVLDVDALPAPDPGQRWEEAYLSDAPLINRLLAPLMIFDQIGDRRFYRYPGTVVENVGTGELTVLIPVLTRGADGELSSVQWRAVVEEIRDSSGRGPLSYTADSVLQGVVALRINYPYQAGNLIAYQARLADGSYTTDPGTILDAEEGVSNSALLAEEAELALDGTLPDGYALFAPDTDQSGTHAGPYGMGRMWARFGNSAASQPVMIRPFRRVLSAQALYRRELLDIALDQEL
jgi:hypothetical protein